MVPPRDGMPFYAQVNQVNHKDVNADLTGADEVAIGKVGDFAGGAIFSKGFDDCIAVVAINKNKGNGILCHLQVTQYNKTAYKSQAVKDDTPVTLILQEFKDAQAAGTDFEVHIFGMYKPSAADDLVQRPAWVQESGWNDTRPNTQLYQLLYRPATRELEVHLKA
mmetsp:Transcript_28884/g.65298  ORF Transcript_28884/g.65298 Transcript_28884/m.65298 type:complete len:165 (+) Transcript_28884:54-548(+)